VELAVGETFDVPDATGAVAFTITVDSLVADVPCTSEHSVPPENGHFVGVGLRVTTGAPPADGKKPVFRPGGFRFLGADGTPVKGLNSDGAAACLGKADDFPSVPLDPQQDVAGTIVLDVPPSTGTIAYRPDSGTTRLLWQF
jgi:hypothetical protein